MKPSQTFSEDLDRPLQDNLFGHGSDMRDEEPPDVKGMWKKFNKFLNKLTRFGKKKEGEPDDDDPFNDRETSTAGLRIIICLFLFFAGIFWMGTGFYSVQEGQSGIVMTFGRVSKVSESGINWHMPYPFQSHILVDVSGVRTMEIGYRNNVRNKKLSESLMLTSDGSIVDVQAAVHYRLKSPTDYVFNNTDQEDMVRDVVESVLREAVGRETMAYVVGEGRDRIGQLSLVAVQETLDHYNSGVVVINVAIQAAGPPDKVQEAYDDAVKAEQDSDSAKNSGLAYAQDVVPRARGEAIKMKEEAIAYKLRVIAQAQGDTARFRQVVAEYRRAPGVTRDRMYYDTMQQIFQNTTKVMVDAEKTGSVVSVPVDKLIGAADDGAKKDDAKDKKEAAEADAKKTEGRAEAAASDRTRGGR